MPKHALYRPPAPHPIGPNAALFRSLLTGDRDLLALMPRIAYQRRIAKMGITRRGIFIVNDPATIRRILVTQTEDFPKNDLMVGSLAPLINDGMFVSSGTVWQRQRAMVDPAFTHIGVKRAFEFMAAAVDDFICRHDRMAMRGEPMPLEQAMSNLTADIIYRTIFSEPLDREMAKAFFEAWATFQNSVATIDLKRMIFGKAWAEVPQPPEALTSAKIIRDHLSTLVDARLKPGAPIKNDIVGDVIAARDSLSGRGFDRDEIIDQIGVFFLAGHETTASALTWSFYILAERPELLSEMRREMKEKLGPAPIDFEATKKLTVTRNIFRETLRLYPPLGFIPRVAAKQCVIEGMTVPRGAMIMISPWLIHRHEALWENPDRFDHGRFMPEREKQQTPGAYIPFGMGPRICIGAAFAMVEAVLILARLARRYDFRTVSPETVRAVSHLATRPHSEVELALQFAPGYETVETRPRSATLTL